MVCGARRFEAAKLAAMKVPVIRRQFTPEERLTAQVVENLQRASLTPLEEAKAFDRFRSEFSLTTRQIASRVGVSQSWVSKRLSLLKLPDEVQTAVGAGKVEIGAAMEIVKVADDPALVAKLAEKAASGHQYVAQDVARELETRDRTKEQIAKEKALAKGGEKSVVHLASDGYNAKPPKGNAIVTGTGYYVAGSQVVMSPEKHAKLACHAVGVHPRTGETVEVCTEPGKHRDPAAANAKAADKKKAELAAEKEKEREELERVIDWLRVVAKKPTTDQVIDVSYLALSDPGYAYASGELVIRLMELGEPPEPKEGEEELGIDEWHEMLLEKIAETPAGRTRLTFVYALDRCAGLRVLDDALELLGYGQEEKKPSVALTVVDQKEVVAA